MDNITIRKAKLKDLDMMVGLWNTFMKLHNDIVIKNNNKIRVHVLMKKNADDMFYKWTKSNIRSKDALVLIAEYDGVPIGYSMAYIKNNVRIYKIDKTGYLSDMYIKKKYQGKGISSMLKDKTFAWMRKNNIAYASVQVYDDNLHAYNVYKNWGFFEFITEMRKKL